MGAEQPQREGGGVNVANALGPEVGNERGEGGVVQCVSAIRQYDIHGHILSRGACGIRSSDLQHSTMAQQQPSRTIATSTIAYRCAIVRVLVDYSSSWCI